MRSGTCRNLNFSTKLSVPFLIYAVMLSLRIFSKKLQSEQCFLFFFCGWVKNKFGSYETLSYICRIIK